MGGAGHLIKGARFGARFGVSVETAPAPILR
jgi:hypothetical protein